MQTTPGVKMMYLIKRKPATSREELVAHWFANHMPLVIERQHASAARGKPHARRYLATLFDADGHGQQVWDGVAQLWWDQALPSPAEPHGMVPADSFQQRAEPYVPWASTEHVLMDGGDRLAVEPLAFGEPFPTTRSGFFKVTFLVGTTAGTDHDALFDHWLHVHGPNVRSIMGQVGGFRYVISHSLQPEREPYAGMDELYFGDLDGWRRYTELIQADGMQRWVDPGRTVVQRAHTELIGIP